MVLLLCQCRKCFCPVVFLLREKTNEPNWKQRMHLQKFQNVIQAYRYCYKYQVLCRFKI
ncbi:hypothetical protein CDL12_07091 [Handroanthus impetiginosus]|uniref:Uncharacterized protein n=1 Tax=Handroanthus impetiginosus TaxID=429701 RepID=A0A2G9HRS1_9LAMI|nr:hypothetical protein CDL12_07091 [Handroanthus impetiginosus]